MWGFSLCFCFGWFFILLNYINYIEGSFGVEVNIVEKIHPFFGVSRDHKNASEFTTRKLSLRIYFLKCLAHPFSGQPGRSDLVDLPTSGKAKSKTLQGTKSFSSEISEQSRWLFS